MQSRHFDLQYFIQNSQKSLFSWSILNQSDSNPSQIEGQEPLLTSNSIKIKRKKSQLEKRERMKHNLYFHELGKIYRVSRDLLRDFRLVFIDELCQFTRRNDVTVQRMLIETGRKDVEALQGYDKITVMEEGKVTEFGSLAPPRTALFYCMIACTYNKKEQ